MTIFKGQTLYLRNVDQDQAWGTNIKSLLGAAAADTNWTVTFTSTSNVTQTVNPYTNISNVSADNRTNLGWALNQSEASNDSMGSLSTRKRFIPAGTWNFIFNWTSNAPARLASYTVQIVYSVYRVATNGGTRTLLFTASSSAVTVSLLAGSDDGAASSAQNEILFEPGETLHIAVQIISKATSALLGAVTNTVVTCTGGTSGNLSVTLPTPGLRDLNFQSNAANTDLVGQRTALTKKTTVNSVLNLMNGQSKLVWFYRTLDNLVNVSTNKDLIVIMKELVAQLNLVNTTQLSIYKTLFESIAQLVNARQQTTHKTELMTNLIQTDALAKLVNFYRRLDSLAQCQGQRSLLVEKHSLMTLLDTDTTINRALSLYRSFNSNITLESLRSTLVIKNIIESVLTIIDEINRHLELYRTLETMTELDTIRRLTLFKDTLINNALLNNQLGRLLDLHRHLENETVTDNQRNLQVYKNELISLLNTDIDLQRVVIFARDFESKVQLETDIVKSVIFVRDFQSSVKIAIKPRIALDWDDLPNPEGGGTITNFYRPLFVFDD